jgi:hypothetical protein
MPSGDGGALDRRVDASTRMTERDEMALLLVRLGEEDGGRVRPSRMLDRPPGSQSRRAFLDAQDHGWLDGDGFVTYAGRLQLEETT